MVSIISVYYSYYKQIIIVVGIDNYIGSRGKWFKKSGSNFSKKTEPDETQFTFDLKKTVFSVCFAFYFY